MGWEKIGRVRGRRVSMGLTDRRKTAKHLVDTLFFFYKNLFYKNVEAEIDPNFKNVLRTFLRLRVD